MSVEREQIAGGDGKFLTVYKAAGVNTQNPRQSIKDEQFSWLENVQPVDDGNYSALYSNGSAVYTAPGGKTIVYDYLFNIGSTEYVAVFLSDGTAVQVNLGTLATTTISSTGNSFYPGLSLPQCAQFGQQGIIIVSTATLGYSFWNGNLLFTAGGVGPVVTITAAGSGYTTAPAVVFSGGHGTGASAAATIANGEVTNIQITNPGSGYQLGDTVDVTLVGGQTSGTGAALTAFMTHEAGGSGAAFNVSFTTSSGTPSVTPYILASVSIVTGGSGYSSLATVMWNNPGGGFNNWAIGPPALSIGVVGGVINSISFPPGHYQWDTNTGSPAFPTITASDMGFYTVTSVSVSSGGSGYSPSAAITVTTATGNTASPGAVITPVITSGVITGTNIVVGGVYTTSNAPLLSVTDPDVLATATAELMPFGISGTCVETYASRIWIGNGPLMQFSAPDSSDPADWDTANGAGAFQSTDSFLRVQFTALKQIAGFLYTFADSSINVISNVQTSGSPTLLTTFNNQNVDPQVGTPWPNSVQILEQGIVFANPIGVFILTGGDAKKISDDLDGIFENANSWTITPSSAVMTINNIRCYILNVQLQGPFDMSPRNGMVMYDGKRWWIGSQLTVPSFISTQEINSNLNSYGTNGSTLYPMFTTPSGSLTKVWQTKLLAGENVFVTKQAMRLYTMAIDNSSGGYTFTGTFDFQLENAAIVTQSFSVTQSNLTGTGSVNANVRGNYLGMTLQTTKDDFTLITHQLLYQEQSPLGG